MMTIAQNKERSPKLGEGVYLAYDVAQILNLPYSRVRNLMSGFWQSYTFGSKHSRAINFHALIEFYIYYYLREQKITALEIKRLHATLSKDFKVKYPFASLKILAHTKEEEKKGQVWIDFQGQLMKADGKLQPSFREFMAPYVNQIEFGEDSIAKRFFPLASLNHSKRIVVDPLHQFGLPVITGTNIQTLTVYTLYKAGETKKNIGILYNIEEKAINDVLAYYEKRA